MGQLETQLHEQCHKIIYKALHIIERQGTHSSCCCRCCRRITSDLALLTLWQVLGKCVRSAAIKCGLLGLGVGREVGVLSAYFLYEITQSPRHTHTERKREGASEGISWYICLDLWSSLATPSFKTISKLSAFVWQLNLAVIIAFGLLYLLCRNLTASD